ncbi:hypothetical protein F4820DRAFT_465951 [Hypoxylon rubiginosum]|uniref:Uncharacterized protein n=1 Tax=Hypoxylon rubiginosum TaxID=110542 RepID=A0ACB9YLV2_9PEZI|nr:hypothetical protein F4820DRAFT_465951 [Hypoxylon rubiginosum]
MATNLTSLVWGHAEGIRRQLGYAQMLMGHNPGLWLGSSQIFPRDLQLIHAQPVEFLDKSQKERFSHLRNLVYKKRDEENTSVVLGWTRESDGSCEAAVLQGGGTIHPQKEDSDEFNLCVGEKLQVQINFLPGSGTPFDWGFLSCVPAKTRIFRGPSQTCKEDPWDAMILYDCVVSPGAFHNVQRIATRKWDILLLKVCDKDFTHPWLVVNMRDTGAAEQLGPEHEVSIQ